MKHKALAELRRAAEDDLCDPVILDLLNEIDRLRADRDSWQERAIRRLGMLWEAAGKLKDARYLLAEFVEPGEPCRYDHHDCCQAHQLHERPCPYERASELLKVQS